MVSVQVFLLRSRVEQDANSNKVEKVPRQVHFSLILVHRSGAHVQFEDLLSARALAHLNQDGTFFTRAVALTNTQLGWLNYLATR